MRTGSVVAVLVATVVGLIGCCCPTNNTTPMKVPTADLPAVKALSTPLASQGLALYWTAQWPLDKNETVAHINIQPGHLYAVTDRNRLLAMDSRTGQFLWDAELENQGLDTTPVCQVSGSQAVVAVLDQFFAFDADTGKKLVHRQLERTPSTRLVSYDGFVYYGTNDGWLEAVNVADPIKDWSRWTVSPILAAPAADTHGVYVANTAGNLTANSLLNRAIHWAYPPKGNIGAVTADLAVSTGSLGLILVPSLDYSLYAMNPSGGRPAWICPTGNPLDAAPHSAAGQIYFVTETHVLYCVKEVNGEKPFWTAPGIDKFIAASPTAVYVRSTFNSGSGTITALDPATGAVKYHVPTGGLNRLITNDLDGRLFAADSAGHIICICDPNGQYDLKPAALTNETPTLSTPTIKKSAKPAKGAEPKK